MPYVSSGGQVLGGQSPWRISIVSDMFWALINFVVLFFHTMFSPNLTKYGDSYSSNYKPGDGPSGGPRRRLGRINHGGGGAASPGNLPPGGG
ncbi:selenoprotein K-like [Hydractinia symbiolongicarpus]|uniref:selenoprotein K-like n=1 Tax=Hydractinia symbiolongicarpus TaxID=13093 RepID=UPI00254AAD92|nr:selenoprotein K-like [Hydractinia symbiolongicarpus]